MSDRLGVCDLSFGWEGSGVVFLHIGSGVNGMNGRCGSGASRRDASRGGDARHGPIETLEEGFSRRFHRVRGERFEIDR